MIYAIGSLTSKFTRMLRRNMADDKNTPIMHPVSAPAEVEAAMGKAADVLTAEQKLVQMEQRSGEIIAREQKRLDEARQAVEEERRAAFGDTEVAGYHHKTWATFDVLQCAYCPWDVIDSKEFNYMER